MMSVCLFCEEYWIEKMRTEERASRCFLRSRGIDFGEGRGGEGLITGYQV